MSRVDQDDQSIEDHLIIQGSEDEDNQMHKIDEEEEMMPKPSKRRITSQRKTLEARKEELEDEEGPDDAGKEQPDDQEYDAEDERGQEEDTDHHIDEPKYDSVPASKSTLPQQKTGKTKKGQASIVVLESECDELLNEMIFASDTDCENNKKGNPGLAKLRIVDKVITKLKSKEFSEIFLDKDGLNVINKFISKLPDGSWPLSNVRNSILKLIYTLPAHVDHLKHTDLGRTLQLLQSSPKELIDNKKQIQMIKDKWSRIVCNIPVEYTSLETYERDFKNFNYKLPVDDEEFEIGKRKPPTEDELNQNLSYNLVRPRNLGYNFTIRPNAPLNSSSKKSEEKSELLTHLMRIRRATKRE